MAPLEVVREGLVEAPIERVWELVDEPSQLATWFSLAERVELLDGSGEGRRQRLHGHWGKRQSEVDQRVIVHRPPHELAWRHEAERLDGKPAPQFAKETVFSIFLTADDDRTKVRMVSRQEPASPIKGLVMRLVGGRQLARGLDDSLRRLQETARA
jgi:uncharacterized protein YndB with AHSA1/START domain